MAAVIDKSATPQRKAASEGNFYPECESAIGPGMNERVQRLRRAVAGRRLPGEFRAAEKVKPVRKLGTGSAARFHQR